MGDDMFGPQLQGAFDFTLRFELIFFSIVPSIIWFAALPFYVYSYLKSPPLAHAGLLLWTKLAFALSLVAVQAAALAYFHHPASNCYHRHKDLRVSLGREATAGFWSRSFFFWMNGILVIGFQRNLTKDDIGDIGFETEALYTEFARCWEKANKESKFALLLSCIQAVPEFFVFVILPRFLSIGFNFSQPFLLQRVVSTVSEEHPDPRVVASLIGATALIYTGKSMCAAWYNSYRLKIRIGVRGMLLAALYNKTVRLSTDELSKAAALTLMSTDVNGTQGLISLSYESWAKLIEIGLGLGILAAFVGASCIFTLVPAIISSILSTFATKKMARTRKRWNERIEVRVADTSSMLSQIKDLKMTGLAPIMADKLQQQMNSEVKISMGDRHARSLSWAISALVETAAPALVIGATLFWTRASTGLSVADFYTTLALTQMVTAPFASVLVSLPYWATAWASVQRVQEYLCKEERQDYRTFYMDDSVSEKMPLNPDGSELGQFTDVPAKPDSTSAVQLNNVSVFSLRNACLKVPKGSKTMLCGPVGSGKSTILKAILGEVQLQSGDVSLSSKSVAYCEQEPWVLNDTIEQNIIGNSARDSDRLWKIINICALTSDLDRLPDGIMTLAGSEGCNLSGGQKQRISLARSLYVGADLVLLDDVFSALDIPTASIIRHRLFGKGGYFQEEPTTLIMATNIAQHLEDADFVFEVNADGQVQAVPQKRILSNTSASEPNRCKDNVSDNGTDSKETSVVQVTSSDTEIKHQRYGDWALYGYFFRAAGLRNVILWLAAIMLAAIVERFPPIYVRIWQDNHPHNNLYFIGYAIISFANPVSNMACSLAYFYLVNAAAARSLHRTLANTTSRATLDFLTKEDTGVLLNRFSQDISAATQELPLYVMPTSWLFFTIFIDIGVIASGANYASPILPLFLVLVNGCPRELLSEWISMWTGTETSMGAVARTREFAQTTPLEEDLADSDSLAAAIPDNWPQSGSVEVENVSASYQADSATPRSAFENVSVSIPSGKKVGIVGRTGSGKTSLLLTLLNLLEHSGTISIDGVDIRRVPRNMLRSRITTITQSGIELPGSVRFNINPYPASICPGQLEVTDDMMVDVLCRIGAGLWESIQPRGGLDADMSKLQLSQGQKQLVQLARAVVHKQSVGSKLVLVDEGSASLDQETERRVQAIIDDEFQACTVITVSHRPAALQHVDFFVRMTDGRAEVVPSTGARTETDVDR
ncbi:hypothetical protein LMH87_007062 [Akanthomyces muscarius]|uniref:ABC transporter n=1 Tax=Akanthomyces muscarius TaxID=2231603 RepID=A0A9W8UTM7_AKAMU|nr:hypothetical protein LMH87_007062 [Akanthomyces muscarius]KAJ4165428.1 hypothetical protein LMH87_007062 [Akanthomyces muscarius]